jgi:uncharacterized membrane protein
MDKMKLTGAVLATAVGLLFLAQPLMAADDSAAAQLKCVGGNSCKGQSSCKSASSSCKGQNSCKGKGWVTTSSADDCTQKGGHVEKE